MHNARLIRDIELGLKNLMLHKMRSFLTTLGVAFGVGAKNSSSDLLVANCDEFIYYDDLVRAKEDEKNKRATQRPPARKKTATAKQKADNVEEDHSAERMALVLNMVEELLAERGGEDKVCGSMIKQAMLIVINYGLVTY